MIVIEEGAFYILSCVSDGRRFMVTDDNGCVAEFDSYESADKHGQEYGYQDYQIVVDVKRQIVENK